MKKILLFLILYPSLLFLSLINLKSQSSNYPYFYGSLKLGIETPGDLKFYLLNGTLLTKASLSPIYFTCSIEYYVSLWNKLHLGLGIIGFIPRNVKSKDSYQYNYNDYFPYLDSLPITNDFYFLPLYLTGKFNLISLSSFSKDDAAIYITGKVGENLIFNFDGGFNLQNNYNFPSPSFISVGLGMQGFIDVHTGLGLEVLYTIYKGYFIKNYNKDLNIVANYSNISLNLLLNFR